MAETTRYDRVAYPAGLYATTTPDHLAMVARLHGLAAPDPATGRVLEIAGGDGVNLLAMAAAHPDAEFLSFDLSAAAVARGAALARAAGLGNARVEVGEVVAMAQTAEERFDYVIAHGLYAWVPEPVRAATLKLIARVLSPDGVAFVSYNALPGGHLRRAVREMLLLHVGDIAEPDARVAAARAALKDFVTARPTDRPSLTGLRQIAEPMLAKNAGSLYHDELSDHYAPQALIDVVTAAEAHGLAFLNDAMPSMVYDGLPGTDGTDAEVVRAAQADDYDVLTFFHQTLLIRAGRAPRRRLDPAALASLHASSPARRTGETSFVAGESETEIDDKALADWLEGLGKVWPDRRPLAAFADAPDQAEALVRLHQAKILTLHAGPFPGCLTPGDTPRASGLALAQLAAGDVNLFTLDHRTMAFVEPGPRAFLALLDGTRDRARLAADWAASGYGEQVSADDALEQLARAGMMSR